MRVWPALLGLCLATAGTSCAFLLDFDELQSGPVDDSGLGGQGGSDGSTVEPIPIEKAAQAVSEALCGRGERCMPQVMKIEFRDEDCVDLRKKTLTDRVFAKLAELDQSTFEYDGVATALCVKALNEQACAGPKWGTPVECDLLDGSYEVDEKCLDSAQCVSGAYCDVTSGCPGLCKARPKANEACPLGICDFGLECANVGSPTCLPPVTQKEGPCLGSSYPDCQLGMFCIGGTAADIGKCQLVDQAFSGGSGSACDWNDGVLCDSNYRCTVKTQEAYNNKTFEGTCTAPVTADKACTVSLPDPCPAGHYCKPTQLGYIGGTCSPLPTAGEDCAFGAARECAGKHRCVSATKKCAPLAQLKDACLGDAVCYSGNCDGGFCAPPEFCPQTD